MNENHSGMSTNSGYYDLPIKKNRGYAAKTLYSDYHHRFSSCNRLCRLTCFFAPWLFGSTTLTATSITLIGAYYTIFAMFAPFILFCSCIHGCSKFNLKLFAERETTTSMPQTSFMQFKLYA